MPRPDFNSRPYDVLRVLEVHDGDTYRFLLDTGFDDAFFGWLRLKDYSCPELRVKDPATGKMVDNPPGIAARMAAIALTHNYMPTMWVVTTKVSPDAAAKLAEEYGETRKTLTRYVADVWLAPGMSLGAELAAAGHATPGAHVG